MTLTSQFAVKRSNAGVRLLGKNYIPEKKCGDAKWLVTGRLSVGIGLTSLTKAMVPSAQRNSVLPTTYVKGCSSGVSSKTLLLVALDSAD